MRTIQDIMESLVDLSAVDKEDFIEVTFPVAFDMNFTLITLRIYINEDCYVITDEGWTFEDTNDFGSYYYDLYIKDGKYHSFDIRLEDETFFKEYKWDFDIHKAINEFVRFLLYFDDFMSENGLC